MNTRLKKRIALSLGLLMLLPFAGCRKKEITSSPSATIEILIPLETPAPSGIPTPEMSQDELFQKLDQAYFQHIVTADRYTFQNFVQDPSSYGIDESTVTVGWGTYSIQNQADQLLFDQETLSKLDQIDREQLDEPGQTGYDVLKQYLETEISKGQYAGFDEPLGVMSGFQTSLPLILGIYQIDNEQDAENYLKLLADVPRYFDEILIYEQEKAAKGLFMTQNALDTVLKQCDTIIKAGKHFYLLDTFEETLESISEIASERKKELLKQNEELVTTDLIGAYQKLRDGLELLRSECRANEGMYALGDEGLAYYAAAVNTYGSCDLAPDEALALLESEMYNMTVAASIIRMENKDAAKTFEKKVTTGDMDSDLKYLKNIAEGLFGTLPDHTLTATEISKELQAQAGPAFYVKPSLDQWQKNEILLNPMMSDNALILTLAHETYPGHLYETVAHRSTEELSLTQQVLPLEGYTEGWAQSAVKAMIETQGQFSRDGLLLYHDDSMVLYGILPAIVSIKVNAQGESLDEIKQYLSAYGVESNAEIYYQYAVDSPFYYLSYALGYCQMQEMIRGAQNDLGDAFDLGMYLRQYLSYGPAQINILREQMDVWTDEQVSD